MPTMQDAASTIHVGAPEVAILLLALGVIALVLASLWRVFERAGEPGWAAIVPIYNLVVLLRVARMSGWWTLLLLIPYVGAFALIPVSIGVARRFDRGTGFGLGLWALPFVFYPILAFADRVPVPVAHAR